MYNIITIDKQGNVVNKVEPEEKAIFYIGNSMTNSDICKIIASDIFTGFDAFAWSKEDFYRLYGKLSQKVGNYLDNL